jgi:endonuclease III
MSKRPRRKRRAQGVRVTRERMGAVLDALVEMYGPYRRRRGARAEPLDELVAAMLSQNTSGANARRGYEALRRAFPTWNAVMAAPVREVQACIAICGLSRMRSRRLQAMLRRIEAEQGGLTLRRLRRRPAGEVFEYLTSLHGIGPKTAAWVMLFGLDVDVLPVDNGILRVVRRLKLVRPIARDLEAQRSLTPLIRPGQHHAMHVLAFKHAKERCKPRNPKCADCALLDTCPFGQRRVKHQRVELDKIEQTPSFKRSLARVISSGIRRVDAHEGPKRIGRRRRANG